MKYPSLSKELQIGEVKLPNRIVMPPMALPLADDDGFVTQAHLDHYERSAGPGLIIVEGTAVLAEGRINRKQLGIYSDHHIEGLARLAGTIHAGGALAGIQIMHDGATAMASSRQGKYRKTAHILFQFLKQQLSVSYLQQIASGFRLAARRAAAAGFDIIELHAAHGKLFSQLLSPLKNRRLDKYGGRLENRGRFLFEVFETVRQEVDGGALVTCRLGLADRNSRGLSLQDGLSTAVKLESKGVKLLDISNGSGVREEVRPEGSKFSSRLHLARQVKERVRIPIIGGGDIRHPDLAEQALQEQMADLIWVGRGLLADPAWARKTLAGDPEAIVPCRNCPRCFYFSDYSKCPAGRNKKTT